MRYFAEISYLGTRYAGWQRQDNALGVQEAIEDCFATVLRQKIPVTGCGRTDAGVHALSYFLHFDAEGGLGEDFRRRINGLLPADIAIHRMGEAEPDFHARFDARERQYVYRLVREKSPFLTDRAFRYHKFDRLDGDVLEAAASLLMQYEEFLPFCKTGHDSETYACRLVRSDWERKGNEWRYRIGANRFLRGMVRLIVGMCLRVATGDYPLEEVKKALETQSPLRWAWSVPAHGLFLERVRYRELESERRFY